MVGMKDGSPTIVVSLLPARSAEPPQSSGSTGASALRTLPDAVLVAIGPSAGEKPGRTSVHPGGKARDASRSSSARRDGLASAHLAKAPSQCALRRLPRAAPSRASATASAPAGKHTAG